VNVDGAQRVTGSLVGAANRWREVKVALSQIPVLPGRQAGDRINHPAITAALESRWRSRRHLDGGRGHTTRRSGQPLAIRLRRSLHELRHSPCEQIASAIAEEIDATSPTATWRRTAAPAARHIAELL
jgi:hypothetical protein